MRAWLTTVVARVSLNMLRSRRSKREEPLGVHVPEPIVSSEDGLQPEREALLADSVGLALLVTGEPRAAAGGKRDCGPGSRSRPPARGRGRVHGGLA
jgi:RNA polymerase sigma-70 factor (ECF subfamily)